MSPSRSRIAQPVAGIVRTQSRYTKWASRFVFSAAAILTLTGAAKISSVLGNVPVLEARDPILYMSFRHLMFAAGIIELIVAAICLFGSNPQTALALVAWLATCFLIYRIGLWSTGWRQPCSCLGHLTDALGLAPAAADAAMKGILGYLLLGSYAFFGKCCWKH